MGVGDALRVLSHLIPIEAVTPFPERFALEVRTSPSGWAVAVDSGAPATRSSLLESITAALLEFANARRKAGGA